MTILALATKINEATGADGAELEMLTFWVAACFADGLGRKDIGDYFDARCQQAKEKMKIPSTSS